MLEALAFLRPLLTIPHRTLLVQRVRNPRALYIFAFAPE
jgi:hypothetical protein